MHSLWLMALLSSTPNNAEARTLSLAEAVELALAREPSVEAARASESRAELAELRAQLDRFSFKVDAQLQELWLASNLGGSRGESMTAGLGLSNVAATLEVPLFSGFRVESNVAMSQHLHAATKEEVAERWRSTALAVARAYWAVRRVGLLHDVEARALERIRSAETIAAARVKAGIAPEIDERRARSRRLLQEATLADLEGQRAEGAARLATLLGLEGPIQLSDVPREASSTPPLSQLLDSARTARPDLRAARARLEAQREAIQIAESGYYPQLSAYSLLQFGNNPFLAGAGSRAVFPSANPFAQMAGDFQIGVVLSINLFDTLKTRHAVEDAELEARRLSQVAAGVSQELEAGLRAAYAAAQRQRELTSRIEPAAALAEGNVQINRRRYETGEALVFELLDSEIELLDFERRLILAQADLTLAVLELEAAVGAVVGAER